MIELDIPGFGQASIEYLVCDYNGTLACDGTILPGVRELLEETAKLVDIHVLTSDTFGTAREQLAGLPCTVVLVSSEHQDVGKLNYVQHLGTARTVCVGNGRNDRLMLKESILGVALIQGEGASATALRDADIVCQSIEDALSLLSRPKRLVATLRS